MSYLDKVLKIMRKEPLAPVTPPPGAAEPKLPDPLAGNSWWDLPADLYERWEERCTIMHFDGKLPWQEAEIAALADVLRNAGPLGTPAANGLNDRRLVDLPRDPKRE